MDSSFEIKKKDAAARIGVLRVGQKKVATPTLMPVVSPKRQALTVEDMVKEFKPQAIMTNAYIFLKDDELRQKVLDKGVHDFLGYDGVIATDSGSYQLMVYGAVSTTNAEIIEFEEKIGSDIGSFLDIPSPPDTYLPRAKEQLEITFERMDEAKEAGFLVNAAIQGAKYPQLRAESAKKVGESFGLAAIGGIVPLMEAYRYAELVDVIGSSKSNLPQDVAVHAFGLGHPMVFPLAVLLGCDLFDSAAYALYAQAGRYMTEYGTKDVEELEHMSCTCPVCREHGLGLKRLYGDDRVRELSRHNLWISYSMIERIKQAIHEGGLWELALTHARCHPTLMQALDTLKGYTPWIAKLDPVTKTKAFYYTGAESAMRSEAVNARERITRVSSENYMEVEPFGDVQEELLDIYPFNGALSMSVFEKPKVRDIRKLRAIMEYQFGTGAGDLLPDNVRVKKSKNTKRIRWLYEKDDMIASVRASDHWIIPHKTLAKRLLEKFEAPKLRIVMMDDEEVVECVRDGKSVMAKFVKDVDPNLRAGDECVVVDSQDNYIRGATLFLSPLEIKSFNRGMAARTR